MSRLLVRSLGLSLDGFCAGPHQDLQNPLGVGGTKLMDWLFATRAFERIHGREGGNSGTDDRFAQLGFEGVGAWIIGRNMFGPVRGGWPDESWRGWWGENPPFHAPVFVLTHHPRSPLKMLGGTEFLFVSEGIDSALRQAKAAAGALDVRLGGGASTVRQFLQARLIDELHLALRPIFMGQGEPLFQGLDWPKLGYECAEFTPGERAVHLVVRQQG